MSACGHSGCDASELQAIAVPPTPNMAAETAFLTETVFANHVPPVSEKDEGDTVSLGGLRSGPGGQSGSSSGLARETEQWC